MPRPADPNAKIDLLRAAEAVFVERGLEHAKVEEITERAGHSKGAFYLHFASKEDAFRQIVETILAGLAAALEASDGAPGVGVDIGIGVVIDAESFLQQLHAKDVAMFEYIWANRRVMRLMLEGGGSTRFGYLIDQFAERNRQQTKRVLARGIAAGLFRADLDLEIASLFLAGAYDRMAREIVRMERRPDLPRLLADMQRLCLTGVGNPTLNAHADPRVINDRDDSTITDIEAERHARRRATRRGSRVP